MDFNFAALLVALTFGTGIIAGIDKLFFARARRDRALVMAGAGNAADVEKAIREPLIVEYARSFFPVILIVLLFRSFLAEPFKIPSSSMMPTLLVGDFILVNKFTYGIRLPVLDKKIFAMGEPARGDVIVFRYPKDPKVDYIKRVIGLPGDEITYHNKTVYVNGKEIAQSPLGTYVGVGEEGRRSTGADLRQEHLPNVDHQILAMPNVDHGNEGTYRVPEGQYFVMGDNRDNSLDSRYWGFVPEQNLVGKAFVIWMNFDGGVDFNRIGTLIK